MSKFVLPIKSTYVPNWGLWECLRELIQNAKDEEDQNRHPMSIQWAASKEGGDEGVLTLHNEGADMNRKALLIGHSGKVDANLRGKFGEGLDLALLAGIRAGHKITVSTRTELWTPTIAFSEEYGENCLTITTRAHRTQKSGVTVDIEITREGWDFHRERFIFLAAIADNKIVRVPDKGAILLDESRKGHVYVRGIYVDTLPKLACGYDLDNCDLDRDRRMIDVWDLQWRLGDMYQDALQRRPELLGHHVYKLMRDDAEDTKAYHHHARKNDASKVIADEFRKEHGDDAVPVSSLADARDLEHLGRRGVIVSENMRATLKPELGDVASVKEQLKDEIVESIDWANLTFEEKAVITQYTTLFDSVSNLATPIMTMLNIVSYRSPTIMGTYNSEKKRISIARRLVSNPEDFLSTLVHEGAHATSESGDNSDLHTQEIERLWTKLFFAKKSAN